MKGLIVFLLLASGAASANGSVFCPWSGVTDPVLNRGAASGPHYVGEPFVLMVDRVADWSVQYPNGAVQNLGIKPGFIAVGIVPQVTGLHILKAFVVPDGYCTLSDSVLAKPSVDAITTSGTLWTATSIPFSASVSGGVDPKTYLWNFGDGGTSTAVSPTHSYNTAGTFAVTLTVTDTNGRQGSRQQNLVVIENPNVPGQPGPISREYMGCGTYTATYYLDWAPGGSQPSNYFLFRIRPSTPSNAPWAEYWLTQPYRSQSIQLNKTYSIEVSGCVSNAAATCGPARKLVLPSVPSCGGNF